MTDFSPDLIDLRYSLRGSVIPNDYADALSQAVADTLPWFADDPAVAMHPLAGISAGADGWYLSGRSRLTLRLPASRVAAARVLSGRVLRIGATEIEVGPAVERVLLPASVLYAHFVSFGVEPGGAVIDEGDFFARCRAELAEINLSPRLVCGKAQRAHIAAGELTGFSLMVADLDTAATLRLQLQGLGRERKRGCGVFIPHKSMTPVVAME